MHVRNINNGLGDSYLKVHFHADDPMRARVISALLILIFIFSMSYILIFEQFNLENQADIEKNKQAADMVASNLDDIMSRYKSALQKLASLDEFKQERPTEITQTLHDFALAQPEASAFWIVKTNGTWVAQYPAATEANQTILDRDDLRESMKGQAFVGGPYIEQVSRKKVIIITEPYYQDGEVAGIIGMSIPLSELQKKLAKVKVDQFGYVALINREDGQVLSHPDLEQFRKDFRFEASPLYQEIKVAQTTNGYFENDSYDVQPNMHSFVTLKEAPWVVIIVQPLAEFNFQTNQHRGRNFTILITLMYFLVVIVHYLLMLRDNRNTKKSKQMEKLALVGELAAGIAHEIRNPLTSIKGFIQLIGEKKGQDIPAFYYETILEELDRIDQIVGEMVVLAKPVQEAKSEVNLYKVLQDTVNLIDYQASQQEVKLILKFEPELPTIQGVSDQLKQVFINLLKNAIEAIEKSGTVTIQARRQGDKVVVTVEDTGKGMSKEVIEKLGTPFFSNKDMGTGLGLMITYRIIQNHDGEVSVHSKVGIGTQFRVRFPVSRSAGKIL